MEKLVLLLVMVSTCLAKPEDLSGKVFVFPKSTNTDHVKLMTTKSTFTSFTVCLRFLTDLSRTYSLFSMATPSHANSVMIFKTDVNNLEVYTHNNHSTFLSPFLPVNIWHSLCFTWESHNGLSQLWLDDNPTVKKLTISNVVLSGVPITMLGQDQDSYGGKFDVAQSFVGMISDVHMWDSVQPLPQLRRYMNQRHFQPGNVFNWKSLDYKITGHIFVQEAPYNM